MYIESWVVVDGALEEEATFHDWNVFVDWAYDTLDYYRRDGLPCEIYKIEHYHDDDVDECACAQYIDDHRPFMVTGPDDDRWISP
jgi:hypothetical protein